MNTLQEQLQQVKQKLNQEKPAATKTQKSDSAKSATNGTTTNALANPWVIKPKHLKSASQPAAAQNGSASNKTKRINTGNRKKIQKLVAHWPALFSLESVRPLSVGIQTVLMVDAKARDVPITEAQITYCLSAYAKRPAYLKALAAGEPRYDLHGQPCGEVTAEQQQKALIQLEGMRKVNDTATQQAG
ncbi:ProQ/FinO family protein [Serratia marcescens]|uniref:ProQ/FINO family protein n=1 Tax=Serratia marcescens TaxID=615 RepID=UPI001EF05397|nr:ProQ/FinO family protein [Serratia marcescens]ULH10617.1 ProQ/FinO family protein [Serratia marcescens]